MGRPEPPGLGRADPLGCGKVGEALGRGSVGASLGRAPPGEGEGLAEGPDVVAAGAEGAADWAADGDGDGAGETNAEGAGDADGVGVSAARAPPTSSAVTRIASTTAAARDPNPMNSRVRAIVHPPRSASLLFSLGTVPRIRPVGRVGL